MALNIKDPETDHLARDLAALSNQTVTAAVREAVAERLERLRARASADRPGTDLAAIIQRGRSRPTLDGRDADMIMGYGEDGLPC
jgi:antitoxin VapB